MQFSYVAYTLEEGIVKGKFEAEDEAEARAGLETLGYNPLRIKKPSQFDLSKLVSSFGSVKTKEVTGFARQAATMLSSGSNLLRVLEMTQTEGASKAMVRILQRLHERVSQGESFTIALREHPKVFDEVFVSLVEVGEHTGKLGPALEQLADITSQAAEAKAKAVKAMMMPIFLIGTSLLMPSFMVFVAFPPLIDTFESMNVEVPLMTRVLIGGVNGLKDNIVNVLILVGVLIFAYKMAGRFPVAKYYLDYGKARAPMLGGVILAGELGRFSRVMATLQGAGIDLPSSLRLGMSASKNEAVRRAWADANESLIQGHRIAGALARHSILPAMFVELLSIGEESNTLPMVMEELASSYQKQYEDKIGAILAVLEPVSTFSVGGLVLFMALSTLKPILGATQAVE